MTSTPAPVGPSRPLRYLHFTVPGWTDLHDQVIDEAAEVHLSMKVIIDRRHLPVEVCCAEPPDLFDRVAPYAVRRWHMFAALLSQPRLAGYWKEWLTAAEWVGHQRSLPLKLKMRVTDEESFQRLDELIHKPPEPEKKETEEEEPTKPEAPSAA